MLSLAFPSITYTPNVLLISESLCGIQPECVEFETFLTKYDLGNEISGEFRG